MQVETVAVLIVGLVALATVRVILAVVGRDFAADHPGCDFERRPEDAVVPAQRVYRGTGRNSHLLYFPDRNGAVPLPVAPVAPLAPLATDAAEPPSRAAS